MRSVYVDFVGCVAARVVRHVIGLPSRTVHFHYEAFTAVVVVKLLDGLHLVHLPSPINQRD
jgi:hypothetical protein